MEQRKVCENCLHWGRESDSIGQCSLTWKRGITDVYPHSKANILIVDVAGDDKVVEEAILQTAPDFGCNQWEQAEM